MPRRLARWVLPVAFLSLAVALLVVALPRATGADWGGTEDLVETVPVIRLAELFALWTAGLWLHTFVLRAALPGLRAGRAFALNLGGSSVSNVLPMGGAAGIGLNYAMLRSWGYTGVQISTFTAVSNLVVAVIKIVVAVVGVGVLLLSPVAGLQVPLPLMNPTAVLTVAAGVAAAGGILLWGWRTRRGASLRAACRRALPGVREAVRRGRWAITVGGFGYPALQVVLLWLCLQSVGAQVSVAAVLLTYAVERLLTLLPFTPGGVGVVETGAAAVLVAVGVAPAAAVGGFLLFRVFSYLVEIPVGGAIAICWLLRARPPRRQRAPAGMPAT